MALPSAILQRGLRSAQPAATAVAAGTLYYVTDESVLERSSGTAWQTYSSAAAAAHAASHQNGGADELSVTGLSGLLGDAQTPLAHATSHKSGGSDAIKLDELAAPTDVTTLNVSTTAHGLTPKAPNDATKFLNGVGAWAVPAGGGGSAEVLIATQVCAGAANYDFTGLSGYSQIRVVVKSVVCSSNGEVQLRVSTNNGSSFLSAAGDYLSITGAGVESNQNSLAFYSGASTAARSGELIINGFNLAAPAVSRAIFYSADGIMLRLTATTTARDAIRVFATGGNLASGTIYVFGRP